MAPRPAVFVRPQRRWRLKGPPCASCVRSESGSAKTENFLRFSRFARDSATIGVLRETLVKGYFSSWNGGLKVCLVVCAPALGSEQPRARILLGLRGF